MADVKEMRIFCAEQISVPEELPMILKNYAKAVIRENPTNILEFSANYFEKLHESKGKKPLDPVAKPS